LIPIDEYSINSNDEYHILGGSFIRPKHNLGTEKKLYHSLRDFWFRGKSTTMISLESNSKTEQEIWIIFEGILMSLAMRRICYFLMFSLFHLRTSSSRAFVQMHQIENFGKQTWLYKKNVSEWTFQLFCMWLKSVYNQKINSQRLSQINTIPSLLFKEENEIKSIEIIFSGFYISMNIPPAPASTIIDEWKIATMKITANFAIRIDVNTIVFNLRNMRE
jgi:hypothetical protein